MLQEGEMAMMPAVLDQNSAMAIAAAVIVGTVGASTILVMPGLLGVIVDMLKLSEQQLGFVAAVEIFVMAIAIGGSALFISKVNWRHLAMMGLLILITGNLASIFCDNYSLMLLARAIAGVGGGILIAVSFAALGITSNPDRSFGIYLFFGLMFSAIALYIFPMLVAVGGHSLIFSLLIILCIINIFFLPYLAPHSVEQEQHPGFSAAMPYRLIGIGFLMVALFFIAQGAVWSYLERMGLSEGIEPQAVGGALALSALAGIAGAGIAMALGNRVWRSLPITVGVLVQVASMVLLNLSPTEMDFIVAVMMFNFGWNLCQPYFSGMMAELDPEGRAVVLMGSIQTFGVAAGPFIAALLISPGQFEAINNLGIVCVLASLLTAYVLLILSKQRPSDALNV